MGMIIGMPTAPWCQDCHTDNPKAADYGVKGKEGMIFNLCKEHLKVYTDTLKPWNLASKEAKQNARAN